jgi:hypothetical protein
LKLLITAIASVILTAAVIIYSGQPSTPFAPPPITNPIKLLSKNIFNPNDITEVIWKYKRDEKVFRKSETQSKSVQWALQRRLTILSKLATQVTPPLKDVVGEVSLKSHDGAFHGVYNTENFQWTSGPSAGEGVAVTKESPLGEVLSEGLWGFKDHEITFCQPKELTKVVLPDWFLEKISNQWKLHSKDKVEKVLPDPTKIFFEKLCIVTIDAFDFFDVPEKIESAVTLVSRKKTTSLQKSGNLFIVEGYPHFKSHSLYELLTPKASEDLRDPSTDVGKIAVDRKQSQEDRIKNIRKLRGNSSPEALASLRAIVFEDTDIDLYRYEAVDTLAVTGTKAAYQIIAERLAQVGRSGFELRLARALAGAMGRFFKSDEKTPEDVRRPEVDELIKAAKEHPPGKDLAKSKTQ